MISTVVWSWWSEVFFGFLVPPGSFLRFSLLFRGPQCWLTFLLSLCPEPITRIISKQLDIKLGPFTQEELDSVLRKIKNRKAAGLDEIPPEVWKTRQFDDILLRHCNAVYNQNPIDRWMKGCILPFPKNRIGQKLPRHNTYIHSC